MRLMAMLGRYFYLIEKFYSEKQNTELLQVGGKTMDFGLTSWVFQISRTEGKSLNINSKKMFNNVSLNGK